MWMLIIAGLIDGYSHPLMNVRKHRVFRDYYQRFAEGELLDPDDWRRFRAAMKVLRIDVIGKSAVVVTTLANAASFWIYDNLHPAAVFIDKAARATEPDAWLVLGHYADVPIDRR